MANPADYKRAAANLSARPDRGGMLGMAARMRAGMADGSAGSPGLIGLARTMQNQNVQQPQQVQMPRMGMMGARGMAAEIARRAGAAPQGMKKGGKVKKMAKGGTTRDEDKGVVDRALGTKFGFSKGGSVASKRADGCATKGKTKGRFV